MRRELSYRCHNFFSSMSGTFIQSMPHISRSLSIFIICSISDCDSKHHPAYKEAASTACIVCNSKFQSAKSPYLQANNLRDNTLFHIPSSSTHFPSFSLYLFHSVSKYSFCNYLHLNKVYIHFEFQHCRLVVALSFPVEHLVCSDGAFKDHLINN